MLKLNRAMKRPNAEIAFADTGSTGPSIVFIHGAAMDHTMWESHVLAMSEAGYRVVVWDLRGHGESTLAPDARFTAAEALDDLAALLDECLLEEPVLVGHSVGGNLGQAFARAHADRIAGLIVVDSTWNAGPLSALERWGLRLAAPTLRLIPARTLPGLMARASALSPPAIARTEALFARMPKRRFLEVWAAAVSFIDPAPGERSPVPLGLIRGAQDRTGNIATAMPRWARAEGIVEHVIPNAGHIVTWDAPEATSRALQQILEDWDLRGPTSSREGSA